MNEIGFDVPVVPDGAFYAWADCSSWLEAWEVPTSWELVFEAMKRAQVAISPGRDFGRAESAQFVRFSTANSMAQVQEAVARLGALRRR